MKKILVCYDAGELGMSDFSVPDYTDIARRVKTECGGKFPNFGNKVWLQGIVSAISTPDCQYDFGYQTVVPEEVNREYDCVLMPLANCFYKRWIPWMKTRAEFVSRLKIPVYVVACGVQADSYDELDSLVEDVREPAKRFIDSVYATGGEFALRGYFTAEFFEKLGYHTAVVTGCPSLFQMGRNISVPEKKVSENDFRTTINGSFDLPVKSSDIDKSVFMCQGNFGKYLYDPEQFVSEPFGTDRILTYIKRGRYSEVKALADGRIRVYADIQEWMNFFVKNNISFSFGSRIHGSVMPLLSGVPAMVYARDTRTREMAEFFDIPILLPEKAEKKYSLYELYCMADYSAFNRKFPERFDAFESFLRKCGITEHINQNNIFMTRQAEDIKEPVIVNQKYLDEMADVLKKKKLVYDAADKYCSVRKKIKSV